MRVVVTGGAGFIGANLVRRLVGDDRFSDVVVIDDLSTGSRANLQPLLDDGRVTLHVGSILDTQLLDEAVAGAQAIAHLAARPSVPRSIEDPMASHLANATGTLAVLEAARRHAGQHDAAPYVVVASSSSVYGANPTLPKHEELRTQPLSPYAVTKQATEAYANAYAHCFGLQTLAFRFFNVFGPLQAAGHAYAAVIPAFVDAALRGQPIPIDGDGEQTRDFTYVGSVTAVVTDALARRVTSPEPVNLAFGSRRTLLDVVDELGDAVGTDAPDAPDADASGTLDTVHRDPRPGDVRHSQADRTRLTSLFPDVEPVPFADGLRETVAWFRTLPDYQPAMSSAATAGAIDVAGAGRSRGAA